MNRRALLVGLALCLSCEPKRARTALDVDPLDPAIVAQLDAAAASERAHAAFLLGQLGVSWDEVSVSTQVAAEDRLLRRLGVERVDEVRREIISALGRVARNGVILREEVARPGPTRADAGWALVHLYQRRVGVATDPLDPSGDIDPLERALLAPEGDVRAAVTAALAESKSAAARPILVRELGDVDAIARVEATHGLIALATHDDIAALARALRDPDERVAANAAVAIGVLAEKGSAADTAIEVLTHDVAALTRPAVMIALEEHAFVAPRWTPLFAKLEVLFAVGGQARMSCLAALAHDRALARIERIDHCAGLDDVTRARYVARALSEADPKRVPVEALLALETNDRDARGSILEGLARYDDAKSADAIVAAAADGDLAVRSSAADAAAARKLAAAGPPLLAGVAAIAQHATTLSPEEAGTLPSLLAALTVLRPAGGADVLRAFLDGTPGAVALGARDAMKAYGKPSLIHPTPPVGRYDGDALSDHVVVRLDTDRGMIRMALDAAHAPRNARNFAGLVRAHFYDGLTFHRIVPGFVAQGGDPRGDGTGGADSLVACEPNDLPYREGTVGMALSGPDTGSSQFFITLAPAPRLEGRYTAFARVIEGMDAARALEPGDHIRTARVE